MAPQVLSVVVGTSASAGMVLLNQDNFSNGEKAGKRRSQDHLNLILLTTPDLRKPMNAVALLSLGAAPLSH